MINIRKLKDLVAEKLPPNSSLRVALAAEPDEMPREQFSSRINMYMALLRKDIPKE